jgi:DNA-binding MarR family transcriptional regulator
VWGGVSYNVTAQYHYDNRLSITMHTHYPGHTAKGSALTALILKIFRLHGALLAAGDTLVAPLGLTSARWQVLGSIAALASPAPVAHIARDMGLTRQSVQRVADSLADAGLLEYRENPHHRRASLLILTEKGRHTFGLLVAAQVPWANALAQRLDVADLKHTLATLQRIEDRLSRAVLASDGRIADVKTPRRRRPTPSK